MTEIRNIKDMLTEEIPETAQHMIQAMSAYLVERFEHTNVSQDQARMIAEKAALMIADELKYIREILSKPGDAWITPMIEWAGIRLAAYGAQIAAAAEFARPDRDY